MSTAPLRNVALLFLRIVIAASFLVAGYAKLSFWSMQPAASGMPLWLFYLTLFLSVAEPIGGLAVLLGFLTRTAATCLGIIMVGAIAVMQFMMGMGFMTSTGAGWSYPLTILAGCLVLLAFGAGDWAVEKLWRRTAVVTVNA